MPGGAEHELFVPGRLCLLGEHSDWAGGYRRLDPTIPAGACLVSGTNQGLRARARAERRPVLRFTSAAHTGERHGPFEVALEESALLEVARQGTYFSYVAGVAYQLLLRFDVGGITIDNYATDLPAQKGLSSSAAVCVLVARAFSAVYGLQLTPRGEMELAYLGETTTPSQCGRMDQCCAFGATPVLMEFDGDELRCSPLPVRPATFYFVIVELGAHKDTVAILRELNACYAPAGAGGPSAEVRAGVRRLLGEINQRITTAAVSALRAGDAPRLGALMDEAQAEFDRWATPACPAELSAPVLHRVLHEPALRELALGAKGVGSQGDGCAQFLAKSAEAQAELARRAHERLGLEALTLTLGGGGGGGGEGGGAGAAAGRRVAPGGADARELRAALRGALLGAAAALLGAFACGALRGARRA